MTCYAEEDPRHHHELSLQVPVFLAEALRPSTTLASGLDILRRHSRNDQGEAHSKEVVADEVKGHFSFFNGYVYCCGRSVT